MFRCLPVLAGDNRVTAHGLKPDTIYPIRVFVRNVAGQSSISEEVLMKTLRPHGWGPPPGFGAASPDLAPCEAAPYPSTSPSTVKPSSRPWRSLPRTIRLLEILGHMLLSAIAPVHRGRHHEANLRPWPYCSPSGGSCVQGFWQCCLASSSN